MLTVNLPDKRSFVFGDYANDDYAQQLLRNLLEVEGFLAEGKAKGVSEREMGFLTQAVQSAQADVAAYQEKSSQASNEDKSGYQWPAQVVEPDAALSPGERAIVSVLRQILQASAADRELVPHPLTQEMTRSRVVLPKEDTQA